MSSELYIFLGFSNNTYFFIHTVKSKDKYKNDISFQIYNMLISETMIKNPNEVVMIYDVHEDKTNLIVTKHMNSKIDYIFGKDEIGDYLHKLLTSERNDTMIIEYDYNENVYKMYEFGYDTNKHINKSIEKVTINNVIKTITTKEISYL